MLPYFLLASSINAVSFVFGQFGESLNKPDQPGVSDHVNLKTLVQTRMGDMNGDDSRSVM